MIKMKFDYKKVVSMEFYGDCSSISSKENEKIMKECTVANKKEIHKLLIKNEIDNVGSISTNSLIKCWNPYKYYKSKKWIVIVHSGIEHFYQICFEKTPPSI